MHLGANETVDPHTGLPNLHRRRHHVHHWHGPYLGPDPRDIYRRDLQGLGDWYNPLTWFDSTPTIEPVTVTPAVDLNAGISPVIQTTVNPSDLLPLPSPYIMDTGPTNVSPAPSAAVPAASSGNWFTSDVLPILGLAEQAFSVSVTHQQPYGSGPGYGPGAATAYPGGVTAAQYAAMTPAQRMAYNAQYGAAGVNAGAIPSLSSLLGGSSGMLLLGGVSILAMIMLMRPSAPARR